MAHLRSELLFVPAVVLMLVNAAHAQQIPDKFTNLQVMPKDISKAELMQTMRGFVFALNVRCPYCHVARSSKDLDLDFASDDKPAKKTARVMFTMVSAINHDYVGKIGKPEPIRVECVTCHRGLTQPQPMKAVLADTFQHEGIDATLALYKNLRGKYYGTGQYDFGESPLNQFTETLLQAKKFKEAVAVEELNFEVNHPDSVWSYHLLAMSHKSNGETEKAIADYRKVVQLHPEDTWAQGQIDSLTGGK